MAHYIIFLSHYMYNELATINGALTTDKNISFIPGGVDLARFRSRSDKSSARKKLGIAEDRKVIFSLRRLDKRMGLDRLIEAVQRLAQTDDNYLLLIGGKGPYRPTLEAMTAHSPGITQLVGFIPDDDLLDYFSAADLFVVPTLDLEGFGLVNLEALACGVPVLATPQGGMVELAEHLQSMYLTESNDTAGICHGIAEFFRNGNYTVADDLAPYSWENIAEQYIDVFRDSPIEAY